MTEESPVIFTPDNEPYLGRELLYHFDQMIIVTMEQNALTAPETHKTKLTDAQQMACQVTSQAISLALSIRELVRQGYLFGAHVLMRALVERQVILHYLYLYPEDIESWKRGWHPRDAPGLPKMIDKIIDKGSSPPNIKGYEATKSMNSLMHGKPDSAAWNLVSLGNGSIGYSSSKILNRPDLCDDLCLDIIPTLTIIQAMISAYFPSVRP